MFLFVYESFVPVVYFRSQRTNTKKRTVKATAFVVIFRLLLLGNKG